MATLTDSPEFTANEVYEIQATDPVEGAATGASFSGIGVSNEPHQQLANRSAFLKSRQDTNIGNIASLLAFMAGFVGSLQPNGYLKIPIADVNRGAVTAIIQWGKLAPSGGLVGDADFTVNFPIAFPTACVFAFASLSNAGDNNAAGVVVMETVSFGPAGAVFKSDYTGSASEAQAADNDGFYWIAIGL